MKPAFSLRFSVKGKNCFDKLVRGDCYVRRLPARSGMKVFLLVRPAPASVVLMTAKGLNDR